MVFLLSCLTDDPIYLLRLLWERYVGEGGWSTELASERGEEGMLMPLFGLPVVISWDVVTI